MNRRRFLSRGLAGGLLGAAALGWPRAIAAAADAKDRLACNSWPFRGYFDTPIMAHYRNPADPLLDQSQFPEFLADTFALHAVEFLAPHFSATTPAYVRKVQAGLRRARSRMVNLMNLDLALYDPGLDRAKALATATMWIDIAATLGSPSVTCTLLGGPPFDATVAATHLRPIVAYARSKGLRVLFHNDDPRRESANQILAVIHALHDSGVGTCPDFGNFAVQSPAYALATLRRLLPCAHNICHAKDGIAEHGHFYPDDFAASMQAMRQNGYRGHYSLEWEGLGDPVIGVRALMAKTLGDL